MRRRIKYTLVVSCLSVSLFAIILAKPFVSKFYAYGQNIFLKTKVLTLVLDKIQRYYVEDVDLTRIVEDAIRGMLTTLDPHTTYLSQTDFEKWKIGFEGYYGIGVAYDIIRNRITILSVNENGPACEMGLQPGDRIVKINGESAIGIKREEVPLKLKGPAGTKVTVAIEREGWEEPKEYVLTRRHTTTASVSYAFLVPPDIGYVGIVRFTSSTVSELDESLASLQNQGMKKIVLDLRHNQGGYLKAAEGVADRFLPGGKIIVYTKGRISTSVQEFDSNGDTTFPLLPLIVLIDHISASGSEIVAGAIQDWDRGLLVGTTSFGKGLVQTQFSFQDGSALLITTAKYYTPAGRLIQRDFSKLTKQEYFTYYSDETAPADSAESNRPAFRTSLGRTVYGGGGITPDVEVKPEARRLSPEFRRLCFSEHRFFYTFCEAFASANPEIGEDLEDYIQSFKVSENMYGDFLRSVGQVGFAFSEKDFASNKGNIVFSLKRELAFQYWGDTGRHRVTLTRDRQFQVALEHFGEAQRLLEEKDFSLRLLPGH